MNSQLVLYLINTLSPLSCAKFINLVHQLLCVIFSVILKNVAYG